MSPVASVYRLRLHARRLDRFNERVAAVLVAMRSGAALHLEHRRAEERWWLSTGSEVATAVAHRIIERPDVVNVGDALFGFTPAQTYRLAEIRNP